MPIPVECEECGKKYRMPDRLAGDFVPCRECGYDIEVPGRRQQRSPGGRRSRQPAKSSGNQTVVMASVGAGVVLLAIILFASLGGDDQGEIQVADHQPTAGLNKTIDHSSVPSTPPTTTTPATVNPHAEFLRPTLPPTSQSTPPFSTDSVNAPTSPTRTPTGSSPTRNQPTRPGAGFTTTAATPNPAGLLEQNPVYPTPEFWDVEPDSAATSFEESTRGISIPVQNGYSIWHPQTLEPMLAVGNLPRDFAIVDLNSLKIIRRIQLNIPTSSRFTISPDSKRLAVVASEPGGRQSVQIYDLEKSSLQTTMEMEYEPLDRVLEFLGEDRLLMSVSKATVDDQGRRQLQGSEVWSVLIDDPTDVIKFDIQGTALDQVRLSPGRSYLTSIGPDRQLSVRRTSDGVIVGRTLLPGVNGAAQRTQVKAVGFSPDGKQIGALVALGFDSTVISWDFSTGTVNAVSKIESSRMAMLRSPQLEYLSDDAGWLVGGAYAVSRATGDEFWSNPDAFIDRYPRRLLPGNRVLAVRREGLGGTLTTLNLPAPPAGSGSPDGSTTPHSIAGKSFPLTNPDFSGSHTLRATDGAVAWQSSVDERSNVRQASLPQPVPLSREVIHSQLISGSNVVALEGERRSSASSRDMWYGDSGEVATGSRLVVVTIPDGETVARIDIPKGSVLRSVSESGRRALTQRGEREPVVDVWSLEDGSHVAGFKYAEQERELAYAFFSGDDAIVLASSPSNDKRVVSRWELPACRQTYSIEMARRTITVDSSFGRTEEQFVPYPVAVSPAGQFMAVDLGDRLRVFEVATGTVRGDLAFDRTRRVTAYSSGTPAGFHPNGKFLAMASPADGWTDFLVWDLDSGRLVFDEPLSFTQHGSKSLVWLGDTHLLLGDRFGSSWRLVDLPRHCVIWNFPGFHRIDSINSEGRYLTTNTLHDGAIQRTMLHGDQLPMSSVTAALQREMPEALPPILQTGDKVRIQIGPMSRSLPNFNSEVTQALTETFRQNGITVASDAAKTFRVSMSLLESGSSALDYQVTSFGVSRGARKRVDRVSVTKEDHEMKMELIDADGQTKWARSQSAWKRPPMMFFSRGNESSQALVSKKSEDVLQSSIKGFFLSPSLPPRFYYQPMTGDEFKFPGLGSTPLANQTNDPLRDRDARTDALVAAANADEKSLLKNQREYFNKFYGEMLADDEEVWDQKMKYSPALRRAAAALRWGFAVQFSRNQPAGTFIRVQQVNRDTIPLLDKPTAGAAPRLLSGLQQLTRDGRFGKLPSFRDNRVSEPALLGTGNAKEIQEAATNSRLDFVVVAYFSGGTSSAASRKRSSGRQMSLRVINVATGERLFESARMRDSDVGATAADPGSDLADSVVNWVSENLTLQPVDDLTPDAVRERVAQLEETHSMNPLGDLFELRYYVHRNKMSSSKAQTVAAAIAGSHDFRPIFEGTSAERRAASEALVEKLSARN